MFTLIYWGVTLAILAWSLFTKDGRDAWGWFFNNVVASAFKQIIPLVDELSPLLDTVAKGFSTSLKKDGAHLVGVLGGDMQALAKTLLDAQTGAVAGVGKSTPDNAVDAAALAYTVAFGAGLTTEGIAALFEAMLPEKLQILNGLGPMLEKMSGMDEVAGEVLKPLYHHAFGKSLDYHYRSVFKAELPSESDAVTWHSRRLLDDKGLRTIFKYSGLKDEYEEAFIASAYTPISARALTPLADDTDFDIDKFKELLRFGGHREQDIDIMVRAFLIRALKSARSSAQLAATAVFEAGLMDQGELDSSIDAIYAAKDKHVLWRLAAQWKRLESTTKDYAAGWFDEAMGEYITVGQYQANLVALGYIDPVLSAMVAKVQAKLTARGFVRAVKEADRLAHQKQNVLVTAAMLSFKNGEIDRKQLLALLIAAGLDPLLAAADVALAFERGHHKKPVIKP